MRPRPHSPAALLAPVLAALLAAGVLLAPTPSQAGGWTQPEGGHYLKVWLRGLIGSRALFHTGDTGDIGSTYQDYALNFYGEYGLADGWTGVALGRPFGWATLDEDAVYIGNIHLGIRRALLQGTWNLALEARYGYAPDVGAKAIGSGIADGVPWFYAPTVETHMLDGELQLGVPFASRGWVTASTAFRWLSGDGLDPVITADAHVGWAFELGLDLDFYLAAYLPLGDVTVTNVSGAGQTNFAGYGLDISYWIVPSWSINAGIGGIFFAESNAATPAITLGFAHR